MRSNFIIFILLGLMGLNLSLPSISLLVSDSKYSLILASNETENEGEENEWDQKNLVYFQTNLCLQLVEGSLIKSPLQPLYNPHNANPINPPPEITIF